MRAVPIAIATGWKGSQQEKDDQNEEDETECAHTCNSVRTIRLAVLGQFRQLDEVREGATLFAASLLHVCLAGGAGFPKSGGLFAT
jgi:hypothetical protein